MIIENDVFFNTLKQHIVKNHTLSSPLGVLLQKNILKAQNKSHNTTGSTILFKTNKRQEQTTQYTIEHKCVTATKSDTHN